MVILMVKISTLTVRIKNTNNQKAGLLPLLRSGKRYKQGHAHIGSYTRLRDQYRVRSSLNIYKSLILLVLLTCCLPQNKNHSHFVSGSICYYSIFTFSKFFE